jgi:hypothetical protein
MNADLWIRICIRIVFFGLAGSFLDMDLAPHLVLDTTFLTIKKCLF